MLISFFYGRVWNWQRSLCRRREYKRRSDKRRSKWRSCHGIVAFECSTKWSRSQRSWRICVVPRLLRNPVELIVVTLLESELRTFPSSTIVKITALPLPPIVTIFSSPNCVSPNCALSISWSLDFSCSRLFVCLYEGYSLWCRRGSPFDKLRRRYIFLSLPRSCETMFLTRTECTVYINFYLY